MANYGVDTALTLIQQASHGGGIYGGAFFETEHTLTEQGPMASTVKVASNNWTLTFTSATWGETLSPNPLTIKAYYWKNNGPILPLTFGGQSTVTLSAASLTQADVTCDAITTNALAVGDQVYVSVFADTGGDTGKIATPRVNGQFYSNRFDGVNGADVSGTKQTPNIDGNVWFGPILLSGVPSVTGVYKENAFVGDSRTRGEGNSWRGWMGFNVPPAATFVNIGESSQTAQGIASSSVHRNKYCKPGGRVVVNIGINDIGFRTAAQIWADIQTIAANLKTNGTAEVYVCTITPNSNDTNNTTAGASNSNRVTLNNLIRNNNKKVVSVSGGSDWTLEGSVTTNNINGYFEVADIVETFRDSGIWNSPHSNDFLHENSTGGTATSAAIPVAWWTKDAILPTAQMPVISPAGGTVASGTPVTITGQSGATLRYTDDNSDVMSSSPVYSGPIMLTGTGTTAISKTIKARAFAAGYNDSSQVGQAYSVLPPLPTITTHPQNASIQSGNTATLSASASNAVSVQVQRNDGSGWGNIVGATSSSYTTPALTTANDGVQFRFAYTNDGGTRNTNPATVTVIARPTITVQPTSRSITAGQTATIAATATNATSAAAQRLISGTWTNQSGATFNGGTGAASYTTPSLQTSDTGAQFRFVFAGAVGTNPADTNPATVTVNAAPTPPIVTVQPTNQTGSVGGSATFTATFAGATGARAQKLINGTWMDQGGALFNGTTGVVTFSSPNLSTGDAGSYRLVGSNTQGEKETNAVTLTVNPVVVNPTDVTISPVTVTVQGEQTRTFTGTILPPTATQSGTFAAPDGGTLSGTGLTRTFTAPPATSTTKTYKVTFTSGGITATATITVLPGSGGAAEIVGEPVWQVQMISQDWASALETQHVVLLLSGQAGPYRMLDNTGYPVQIALVPLAEGAVPLAETVWHEASRQPDGTNRITLGPNAEQGQVPLTAGTRYRVFARVTSGGTTALLLAGYLLAR